MRGSPETGESTASIVAREQDRTWARLLPVLRAGATLKRHPKTRRSYVDGMGSLSDAFVRKKVARGELEEAGLDQWKLPQVGNST